MTRFEKQSIEWECARLVGHYANLNDAARWEEAAALFAQDGRLARPSAPDDWIEGRATILAGFLSRPPRTTRHLCCNIVIEVLDADTAAGESALLLFNGGPAPLVGSFHDRFVRTVEGWRFSERRGNLTFFA